MARLTQGGWRKGVLRLLLGAVLVAVVLHLTSGDALALLVRPATLSMVALGAVLHLLQRAARIAKWHRMIRQRDLLPRPYAFLLRVQLIGMLANLLLPVSEALKVWVVSRHRHDAFAATESIVVDTAIHTGMIGVAGCIGAGLGLAGGAVGGGLADHAATWIWLAAVGLTLGAVLVVAVLWWWPRRVRRGYGLGAPVFGWCTLETLAQLALYLLALRAVGIPLGVAQVLAFAPLLFLADLVMLTPSGIGLREVLFATVLGTQSDAPADASVAVGLLVSAMLLMSTLVGGGVALLLPGRLDQR